MTQDASKFERSPHRLQVPKWVFCVGMRRAGSTLQTQLAAAILGGRAPRLVTPETLGATLEELKSVPGTWVLKSHRFLPEAVDLMRDGEAKILYIYRDIRDVAASICRKYEIPEFAFVHGGLQALLREYDEWAGIAGKHVSQYEIVIEDLAAEACRIADHIGCPISTQQANSFAEEFSLVRQRASIQHAFQAGETIRGDGANRYSNQSLLHENHIQSGNAGDFISILSRRTIGALEWESRQWLRDHDYPITTGAGYQWYASATFLGRAYAHRVKSALMKIIRADDSSREVLHGTDRT